MKEEPQFREKKSRIIQEKSSPAITIQDNREFSRNQGSLQRAIQRQEENKTGLPDNVKQGMESFFQTDFSSVRIHPESAKAPEVGALAYTQDTDIHFAPGQFKPDTSAGKELIAHELTHAKQRKEKQIDPTISVGGMPVNDDKSLEGEADEQAKKAVKSLEDNINMKDLSDD